MKTGYRKSVNLILICLIAIFISSCKSGPVENKRQKLSDEQLVQVNRELVIKERERIESYISRKGLEMDMSETGAWYNIINPGSGSNIIAGTRLSLEYDCHLLDGTECYSSDEDGLMNVVIGKSDIPSGLDEILRLLKNDSEAVVILPSNLAYGLIGDGKRVPSRQALIYNLKVSVK